MCEVWSTLKNKGITQKRDFRYNQVNCAGQNWKKKQWKFNMVAMISIWKNISWKDLSNIEDFEVTGTGNQLSLIKLVVCKFWEGAL